MATFLQLAQALRQEIGESGSGPTTVTGQSGMYKRVVDWTSRAWTEIQNARTDWLWMEKDFSEFTVTIGEENYSSTDLSITDFGAWDFRFMRVGLTTSDDQELTEISWDDFRREYKLGNQNDGKPIHVAEKPDKSLVLGPSPDAAYKLNGSYWSSAITLSADSDTPAMPAQFHDVIMFKAMMYYAAYDDAPDIYTESMTQYKRRFADLVRHQTRQISLSASSFI